MRRALKYSNSGAFSLGTDTAFWRSHFVGETLVTCADTRALQTTSSETKGTGNSYRVGKDYCLSVVNVEILKTTKQCQDSF